MKFNTLPILLAGTFLSTSAIASDEAVYDWQQLNDQLRNGNNAIVQNDMGQWQWGRVELDLGKSWAGIDGQNKILTGSSAYPSLFLEWQDDNPNGGNVTLWIKNVTLQNFDNNVISNGVVPAGAINVHSNSTGNNLNIDNVVFKNNKARNTNNDIAVEGGALRNYIVYGQNLYIDHSRFENNSVVSASNNAKALGGGLYVEFGEYVDNVTTNNSYNINNTVFNGNKAGYGGAVYVVSSTTADKTPVLNFTNATFENNVSDYNGGAIYSTENINIYADSATSLFKGNMAGSVQEAIYMNNANAVLNLIANNNGKIQFYDSINGVEGYDINLTGDGTGSISLFNDIANADISVNNVDIILANGNVKNYQIRKLDSQNNANWEIDFDVTNRTADKIITANVSSGTIVLDNLNMFNGNITSINKNQTTNPFMVQILDTQNNNLQLVLSDNVKNQLGNDEYILKETKGTETPETITKVTAWDKEYRKTIVSDDIIYGKLGLTTTKTANDSIGLVESRHQQSTTTTESMGDTFVLVAEADIGDRSFETDNAGAKYVLSEDIGVVAGGLLDIVGATSKNNKSSIDMNNKQGFNLTNATDLVFNDVTLVNALNDDLVNISNANAKVSLNNTNVSGNISGNTEYIMSITGTTSIDGIINNADATATNAILTFGTDTFADSKLTTDGSSIDFVDNVVNDYKIGTLNANGNSNWNIDVNLTDKSADSITSSDSDGTVYINKINNIGTIDEDIVIQVLKNTDNSDGLQLALNEDNIKVVEDGRNIGNEVYVSQNYIQEAGISLATTNTTNDSIKIYQGAIYNALVLINDKETSEERSYIFDEAGIQTLNEDLSSTTAGTLNIIGFNNDGESSIIDANGYSLFDLSNATTLNVSGVTLSNASGDAITVSDQAELNLTNVLFENNGGNAITSSGNVNINVKDTDIDMSENISMNNAVLSFNVENGALNLLNDISGSDYNLHLKGGNVKVSGSVSGVNNLEMSQSAILGLGTSGRISVGNMMHAQDGSSLVSLQSNTSPALQIDVDVANNRMTNGIIDVSGDVSGVYNVIVNALTTEYADGSSIFLTALQDDATTSSEFSVLRVEGSPYMWKIVLNAEGETEGSTWYLAMEKQEDPDEPEDPETPDNPDNPVIDAVLSPEVIAGIGLHTAGIEQTRTVVRNVSGKVANARSYCPNCGIVSDTWNGKQLNNGWVLAQGEYSNIDKPVDMEAKIWGVEGGFDLQKDINNTFGIFASYRNGEYDLSGKGAKYHSNIGSEIDIDSYLAGLYYRYDKNMSWLFATVYGGKQDTEAKTDDSIASFETDGLEFGASVEIGHSFAFSDTTTLSPSLGIFYTQINYDNTNDNVGKEYKWDDIKHLEAELGLILAKNFENGKVYVKPSVIQTFTDDDKVSITGLNEIDTYHDQTLGRIEIGGNYGFNDNWSAYGWANYTFGSSYDATSLGAGVNYAW